MKNEKRLLLVFIFLIVLISFSLQRFPLVLISKESENLDVPKTEIIREPVYDVEYLNIEIPSELVSSSICSVNISLKNTGTNKWNKDGKEPVYISYHWKHANETVVSDGLRSVLPYILVLEIR
jgi:hypothetical protein